MTGNPGLTGWQQIGVHTLADIRCLINRLLGELRPLGYPEKELFGIRLALEEALVNAIKHGNGEDPAKTVQVRYHAGAQQFMIEIEDEGRGFDPESVPDPLAPANLERPGGRGVFLMRHYMSWVQYNEVGNCVVLCKVRADLNHRGTETQRGEE
jgi:serine/threonine-protein kinase RsbW